MWYEDVFQLMLAERDPELAVQMAAYQRDQFPFLGIKTVSRRKLYQKEVRQAANTGMLDEAFVRLCFAKPEREFQYLAVDYLLAVRKNLVPGHLPFLKEMIQTRSWWDTVDGIDGVVGTIVLNYPEAKPVMLSWSTDQDLWVRRVAIDHQLNFKEKTDTVLLAAVISNNLGSREFFINKAIGWSLRDYSKTDPQWVAAFMEENRSRMAPLSIREASKYLEG